MWQGYISTSAAARVEALCGHYVRNNDRRVTCSILMLEVKDGDDLNQLTFDLHWGYPGGKRDYLDAACFIYNENNVLLDHVFYNRNVTDLCLENLMHSGDLMDDQNKIGHHIIKTILSGLPPQCFKVFFTLSAWDAPTIGHFPRPTVSLRDERDPGRELCPPYQLHNAAHSQSVVMCFLQREAGGWKIFQGGRLAPGNAKDFKPLIAVLNTL